MQYIKDKTLLKFLCGITVLLMMACSKESTETIHLENISNKSSFQEGEIMLGAKLNDPYNIDNMEVAFKTMKDAGACFPFSELEPTGQYVRILINNEEELDTIESDTSIIWFDFPLDYEIPEGGTYYHDPSLPDTVVWKYGVVPTQYNVPNGIKKELIYEVFVPADREDFGKYEELYDELEELSEKICNNGKSSLDSVDNPTGAKGNNRRSPKAHVIAKEDYLGTYIPLKGAKVTARHYTMVRKQFTDSDGRCTFPKVFKKGHRVKWGITWEHDKWDIRSGLGIQQYYNGPKQKADWELSITGMKSLMFATIHRALYKAFYDEWGGIQRPYASHRLKVGYIDSYNENELAHNICFWNFFGILNNITIYGKQPNGSYRLTDRIFSTTTHELGHQSMLVHVGGSWNMLWGYNDYIRESYARCVQIYNTNHHYQVELGRSEFKCNNDNFQNWTRPNEGETAYCYTPVFYDLIDNYNQGQNNTSFSYDVISGYTLTEVQDIIDDAHGYSSLKSALKANPLHNATSESIDQLLDIYNNLGF